MTSAFPQMLVMAERELSKSMDEGIDASAKDTKKKMDKLFAQACSAAGSAHLVLEQVRGAHQEPQIPNTMEAKRMCESADICERRFQRLRGHLGEEARSRTRSRVRCV